MLLGFLLLFQFWNLLQLILWSAINTPYNAATTSIIALSINIKRTFEDFVIPQMVLVLELLRSSSGWF